jgi:hypothetical protein
VRRYFWVLWPMDRRILTRYQSLKNVGRSLISNTSYQSRTTWTLRLSYDTKRYPGGNSAKIDLLAKACMQEITAFALGQPNILLGIFTESLKNIYICVHITRNCDKYYRGFSIHAVWFKPQTLDSAMDDCVFSLHMKRWRWIIVGLMDELIESTENV